MACEINHQKKSERLQRLIGRTLTYTEKLKTEVKIAVSCVCSCTITLENTTQLLETSDGMTTLCAVYQLCV